jgi:transglutaminase-like putative cysteine protease
MRLPSPIAALALPALLSLAGMVRPVAADAPRQRDFLVHYRTTVEVPAGARKVEVWLPYPTSDAHQKISDVRVTTAAKFEITHDPELGNAMLHILLSDPPAEKLAMDLLFRADRAEYLHKDFPPAAAGGAGVAGKAGADSLPPDVARWLRPERRVPLDDTIRKLALEVTANAPTDLAKARAIYDYVVANMSYDKSGTGWGNGDIYWACDAKRGNCTDFHALFIGLARAVGLPARFEIGLPLPAERGAGEVAGYHCWAEFYLRGFGWVPLDASEAKKHPDKEQYFFGAHDENRVQLSIGRDLVLSPKQTGEPLNYFVYPYVEIDGKSSSQVAKSFTFQDVGAPEPAVKPGL